MKRTHILVAAVLAWLSGIVFAANYITQVKVWQVTIVVIFAVVASRILSNRLIVWPVILLGVILGIMRGQMYFTDQRWYDVSDVVGRRATVTGRVADEPGWNDDRLYEFYLTDLRVDGRATPGLLKIKSQVGNVQEGQRVQVQGKIGKALGRAPAQIWYAKVVVIDSRQPYPIRLKQTLSQGLAAALSREQAGLVRGLLFGGRAGISDSLESDMRIDGLSHIVAVSGYNLTIIVAALMLIMKRKSPISLIASLAAIGFYVVMTGFAASIVRAAIMGTVILVAAHVRRQVSLWSALVVTVWVMTAYAPNYLLGDMSWQLSVLALVGVLAVVPRIENAVGWRALIGEFFIVSCAAHLATAPLIAYRFGTMSLISPITNLVILPWIPLLMLGGVIVASIGVIAPLSAFTLSWPLRMLLDVVLRLIKWFAQWPYAQLTFGEISLAGVLLSYVCLCSILAISLIHSRKRASKTV